MTIQDEIDKIVKDTRKEKLLADYKAGKKIIMQATHSGEMSKN